MKLLIVKPNNGSEYIGSSFAEKLYKLLSWMYHLLIPYSDLFDLTEFECLLLILARVVHIESVPFYF